MQDTRVVPVDWHRASIMGDGPINGPIGILLLTLFFLIVQETSDERRKGLDEKRIGSDLIGFPPRGDFGNYPVDVPRLIM
jgi:hypothetical protein